ncbi:LacI family DNA-binding transcriptional regulator [Cellulomonas xiejunii]|uniref:LacI family transcriptional regulator n=1 Tax=Cellulomonas xiejunii TaxID=2968083 RepID=A0ABY5KR94_9CELL|nr:LacI family DNA-binding transcriptional regulator [Cellulomonas xiejunii]MCC2321682.1 LacI family transcriptional regulator [Cellulomonas xiejunii]UUI72994.1 LacI family transcriptional regulator [Cellulomonas xiejunii]
MSRSARPTLLDVARAAGVSRATASRALAGLPSVDAELARRVRAAAADLDYRTNTAARALRSGATGSVALVAPSSELEGQGGPFVGAPLRGATAVLFARSVQPVLLLDDGRDRAPLLRYLTSGHVDAAVVVLQRESEPLFAELGGLPLPVVFVGRPRASMDKALTSVDSDNYGGGRLAARTLLEAGRRRVATIAGPAGYAPADERTRGFRDELAAWGLPPGPVVHGSFSMSSGASAAASVLRRDPTVDGLFAGSDLMALGALRVLEAGGRRVPDDVSVVGFDDTVVAETCDPPLTSVRQPLRELGARAAELVLEVLADPHVEPQHVLLPTTLTARESV